MMNDLTKKMDASIEAFKKELAGLRTGRAHASLLDHIQVEAYGSRMPLAQVGSVSVPEPRLITVQVWDKEVVKATEKAIRESDLGLNPSSEGQVIRISIPDLTQERRAELVKIASKYLEESKIAIRNVRRIGMDGLKKQEKDSEISKDEHQKLSTKIQELTDQHIAKLDEIFEKKQKEIMNV